MKLFVNKDIKNFFIGLIICIVLYILAALIIIVLNLSKLMLFSASLLAMLAVLIISYRYFSIQSKTIDNAMTQIKDYLSGNKNSRIDCNEEGELYRLFHEINNLSSVLNAHAENEYKAKKFLKDTISDISHQLKTPLAALNIYNGLIGEAEDISEIKSFAHLSEQELDRIEVLVQNLLKITKLDAGNIVINKNQENVSNMLTSIYEQFVFRAEREGKKIILSGDESITLLCDRSWILEAVGNIVKNALDHTKSGDAIYITWKQFTSIVQIVISDNGNGIHPEDLPHIFKRFYRSRFSQDTQGIGLGLPLAKSIIEEHNGGIEVDSELGKGTAFTINFLNTTKL